MTRPQFDPFGSISAADLRHRLSLRSYGLYWRDLSFELYPPSNQKHGEKVEILHRAGQPWLTLWDGHYFPARPVIVCLRHHLDYIPRTALTTPENLVDTDFACALPDSEAADRRLRRMIEAQTRRETAGKRPRYTTHYVGKKSREEA